MADLSPEKIEDLRNTFWEKVAGNDLDGARKAYKQVRRYNSGGQNFECKRQIQILARRRIGSVQGVGPKGYTRPNWIGGRQPVDRVAARVIGHNKKK